MKQTINLYKHLDQREQLPFSALHVAWSAGGMFVLMFVVSLLVLLQSWSLANKVDIAQQQERTLNQQLAGLDAAKNADLTKDIDQLKQRIADNLQVLNSLKKARPSRDAGFSQQLAGLGRQHQVGLWLDHIQFTEGGEQVALKGVMREPTLLPKYLQALGNEKIFRGVRFDLMRIEGVEDKSNQLRFEVAVVTDEQGGET